MAPQAHLPSSPGAAEPTTRIHLNRKGLTATCVMYLPPTMAATPPPPAEPPPAAAPGTR